MLKKFKNEEYWYLQAEKNEKKRKQQEGELDDGGFGIQAKPKKAPKKKPAIMAMNSMQEQIVHKEIIFKNEEYIDVEQLK